MSSLHTKCPGSRTWWLAVAATVAMASAACDALPDTTAPAPAAAPATSASMAQAFARNLALALTDAGLREAVHRAMAESHFTEHKLVLQEFLGTAEGGRLVQAMAAAARVDESVVRGWAKGMPSMDFYVPFVEHRLRWTGTGDIVVAANLDVDDPSFTAYTPAGAALEFDSRRGTPAQVVIYLHPAEDKGIRRRTGPRPTPGGTLQAASEPTGPVFVTATEDECDPATVVTECPSTGGGSGGGGGGTPATYAGTWYAFVNYVGDGVGGVEVRIRHYAGQFGAQIEEEMAEENDHWSWDGYYYDWVTYPNRTVSFASSGTTWIRVHEVDQFDDDFWGQGAFGGFGLRHRFFTNEAVQYISNTDPCRVDNYNYCGTSPTVDIVYVAN